jgi:hypothetical protein
MRPILVGLLGIATLAGCSTAESTARDAVLDSLKDPESARFGEFYIVEGTEGRGACLVVNAKNSMGGYTGDQFAIMVKDPEKKWQVLDIKETSRSGCESTVKGELALAEATRPRSAAKQKCIDDATNADEAVRCREIE